MQLAISNIAWNDNYDDYYQLMRRYRFSGLEIAPTKFCINPYDHLEKARLISNQLKNEYQFVIVSMQSLLYGEQGLALFQDEEARERLKNYLKKAIIYAEVVGCPTLVFGNPKQRVIKDPQVEYEIAIHFFRELGEFAKEHNTCLCIEPNPREYGTNFINTLFEAKQLVNDVSSMGFNMIIDTSTMLLNHDSPQDAYPVLEYARHIHISMPYLAPLSEAFAKYRKWITEFVTLVGRSNYNHYLSIEMANVDNNHIEKSLEILSALAIADI